MERRKRIAFLTLSDPKDRRSWSGTIYYMARALKEHCGEIIYLGPFRSKLAWVGKLMDKTSRLVWKKRYDYKRSPLMVKRYSEIAYQRLSKSSFDVVFAPVSAVAVASLKDVGAPVIYTVDTTFALINDYYHGFSDYLRVSVRDGNRVAAMALNRADLILYPSAWAAQSAFSDYGVTPEKVHVIPYGANIERVPTGEEILRKQQSKQCRLLFIGVDWDRKGGAIAFETLIELEKTYGIKAELIVCGRHPPAQYRHERMKVMGFLNKQDPQEYELLVQLFREADYLLLPTRSECYGIVFCEASAFGLPSIATDTGGVSGVISEGKNGFLLPPSARGADYARVIHRTERDPERYRQLVRSSRQEFDARLNWDAWGQRVGALMDRLG